MRNAAVNQCLKGICGSVVCCGVGVVVGLIIWWCVMCGRWVVCAGCSRTKKAL